MFKEKYLIKIDDIQNAPKSTVNIEFDDYIEEIPSKTPIKASLEISSMGDYIHVKGKVSATVILQCDLCLENFDYNCDFEIDETYSKTSICEEYGAETELKEGQFITDLQGSDSIDIYDLLYQSVILDFPNKKVCGINCKGGDIFIRDESPEENEQDPRLAVFKQININSK